MNNERYKLNPYWITGFVDGEGCFYVRISKSNKHKVGWRVHMCFEISLHIRDKLLLENLLITLGCGAVNKHGKDSIVYIVSGLKNINKKIIPFLLNMKLKELNY